MRHVAIIGAGSWGTVVAGLAARHVSDVVVWAHSPRVAEGIMHTHKNPRYVTDYMLPENLRATASLEDAVRCAETMFIAVPSPYIRSVCQRIAPYASPDAIFCILTKGIEKERGLLMSDVVAEELGTSARIAIFSGLNHAEEIYQGMPSATVVAARSDISDHIRSLLMTDTFRVYTTDDHIGVQICGAVKKVIAIACGFALGLGAGDKTTALIMTRGLAEIGRVVTAYGGKPLTCMGLAGMGDLIATCTSPHSRNRMFGKAFVHGKPLRAWEEKTHMIIEGAHTVISLVKLAKEKQIDVPIAHTVHRILYEEADINDACQALMRREPTTEFYGILDRDGSSLRSY